MKILIADDEFTIHSLCRRIFTAPEYSLVSVFNGEDALDVAIREKPDLILLDLTMPQVTGEVVLRRLRENFSTQRTPVVIVSGDADVTRKVSGLEAGANDYVTKPFNVDELRARVRSILDRHENELSANPLTGLPGSPAIQKQVSRRVESGEPFALLYIDIDNFKAINDVYGYLKGDEVIGFVSSLLIYLQGSRPSSNDFVGHIGGDDFVYLCAVQDWELVARRLTEEFDARIPSFYGVEERRRGFITCQNRKGESEQFRIASLSVAVVTNERITYGHYAEVIKTASEIKKFLKTRPDRSGSLFMKDRRTGAPYIPPRETPQ